MYTRGMLNGFADQIPNQDDEEKFRQLIRKVPFHTSGGSRVEKCGHKQVEKIGKESGIERLCTEFFARYDEFMTDDDLDGLSGEINPSNINAYIRSITPEISDEEREMNWAGISIIYRYMVQIFSGKEHTFSFNSAERDRGM